MRPQHSHARPSAPGSVARRLAVGALAVGLVAGDARASDLPPIAWDAPEGCPEGHVVEAQVRDVVGPRATAAVTAVHARVEPRGDAWLLVVVFTGRAGTSERRLTLHDCESTARATALLVAIALVDASPAEGPDEPPTAVPVEPRPPSTTAEPPTAEPPTAAPPVTAAPPGPPAAVPADRASRPRAFMQVGPALTLGVLPRTTAGLQVALGAAWPRLRVTLAYTGWFRSPARWPRDPALGADLSLHAAALRVGPVRRLGPVELHAGLGLEFGALRAVGFGSDVNLDRRTWWGATLVGGALTWLPPALRRRAALLLQADVVAPLHRPTLVIDGDTPIFRLGALGLRVAAQLEVRIFR